MLCAGQPSAVAPINGAAAGDAMAAADALLASLDASLQQPSFLQQPWQVTETSSMPV